MENTNPSTSPEETNNSQQSIDVLLGRLAQVTVVSASALTCWLQPDKLYLFIFLTLLISVTALYYRRKKLVFIILLVSMFIMWAWYWYNNRTISTPPVTPPEEQLDTTTTPEPPVYQPVPPGTLDEPTNPTARRALDNRLKLQVQAALNNLAVNKNQDELLSKVLVHFQQDANVEIHFPNTSIPMRNKLDRYLEDLNTQNLEENITILNDTLSIHPEINNPLIVIHYDKESI